MTPSMMNTTLRLSMFLKPKSTKPFKWAIQLTRATYGQPWLHTTLRDPWTSTPLPQMTRAHKMDLAVELARRPRLQCERSRHLSQIHHSLVIQDHPVCFTGCIAGLFAVVIITGVGTLPQVLLPRLTLCGPSYRLSVSSGTQNAIAPLPAPAMLLDRVAAEC